jgi:hypothetical protein
MPDGTHARTTTAWSPAGLAEPTAVDVDINQFPGAAALDVRVLRTNGLETTEIFQERRQFRRP